MEAKNSLPKYTKTYTNLDGSTSRYNVPYGDKDVGSDVERKYSSPVRLEKMFKLLLFFKCNVSDYRLSLLVINFMI